MLSPRHLRLGAISLLLLQTLYGVSAQRGYGPLGPTDCLNGGEYRQRPNGEFYCDCSKANARSAFAGHLCENSATHVCEYGVAVSRISFCVNGGECKKIVLNAQREGHQGCYCDEDHEGDHCEYVLGSAPRMFSRKKTGVTDLSIASHHGGEELQLPKYAIFLIIAAVVAVLNIFACLLIRARIGRKPSNVEVVNFAHDPPAQIDPDGATLTEAMKDIESLDVGFPDVMPTKENEGLPDGSFPVVEPVLKPAKEEGQPSPVREEESSGTWLEVPSSPVISQNVDVPATSPNLDPPVVAPVAPVIAQTRDAPVLMQSLDADGTSTLGQDAKDFIPGDSLPGGDFASDSTAPGISSGTPSTPSRLAGKLFNRAGSSGVTVDDLDADGSGTLGGGQSPFRPQNDNKTVSPEEGDGGDGNRPASPPRDVFTVLSKDEDDEQQQYEYGDDEEIEPKGEMT